MATLAGVKPQPLPDAPGCGGSTSARLIAWHSRLLQYTDPLARSPKPRRVTTAGIAGHHLYL